jgi:aryl hydrocarbon receptor nuclear translocator-like protein 1
MLYRIIKKISTSCIHANTAGNGREMTRMINTHIEASKIGRQIAEQVLDYQRRMGGRSSDSSPDPDPTLAQTVSLVSESQLNASIINMENNSGSSETPTRLNGTYASFSNYSQQPPRSNLENGKII